MYLLRSEQGCTGHHWEELCRARDSKSYSKFKGVALDLEEWGVGKSIKENNLKNL
jgi:hypothetical protein